MITDDSSSPCNWTDADVVSTLVRRFERIVAIHGARTAVQDAQGVWTYDELNARANGIAGVLLKRHIRRGCGVALLLGHGRPLAAAIMGVLKSGGFYIPLDPAYPPARLAEILGSGAATLIITDQQHLTHVEEAARRLERRTDILVLEQHPATSKDDPDVQSAPDDPCCVIFTSGSTGNPKGVVQTHRNLLHSTMWYAIPAGLHPGLRMSMLHSVAAIAAATAFYGALLNGATLFPANVHAIGIDRLPAWIDERSINVLHVVPTLLRRIAQTLPEGKRLETVIFLRIGGEAVGLADWSLWRRCCAPGARMLICLGSTEALNYRQKVYDWNDAPPADALPVGDAMPDKEVLLLDDRGNPAPPGCTGEIVVRSRYLFTGYWQQPELTARLLKPDPDGSGARMFYTGDLGRLDAEGAMYHIGRNDHLVKVMGHRVHPADIEAVVRRMPGVFDAVVQGESIADQGTRLTAFIMPKAGAALSAAAVRTHVGAYLPEHMVPTRVVLLKSFPLLPNGKIDRVAMSRDSYDQHHDHVLIAPRNPFEETLAEIWKKNLRVPMVSMEDDLFGDCGADSMAATAIMADVRAVFGRELPLNTLYGNPTIASLATWLRASTDSRTPDADLVVHPEGANTPVFGVCGAFGHALRLLLIGRGLPDQQPMYGLEPPSMDWASAGCRTIDDMARWYVTRIRRIQKNGPFQLIGTSFGGIMVHAAARQLQRAGESVALLAMVDTNPPDCVLPHGLDHAPRRDWAAGMASNDPLVMNGIRVARQHRAALDAFVLNEPFDGKITYFWCEERVDGHDRDRRALWQYFATRGMDIIRIPGKHGLFHQEPQLSAVVSALRARL